MTSISNRPHLSRFGGTSKQMPNVTADSNSTGTSWASVRWNRPASGEYRGQSTRLANNFEGSSLGFTTNTTTGTSTGSTKSDSLSTRGTTSSVGTGAYRSTRDIFSPTRTTTATSSVADRSAGTSSYLSSRLSSRSPSAATSALRSTKTESSRTPVKHPAFAMAAQRASASNGYVPTFTNGPQAKASTMAITTAMNKPIAKADRPWRQRLAESARIRDHASDNSSATATATSLIAARASRRNSIEQQAATRANAEDLRSSLNALKAFVTDQDSALAKYRRSSNDYSSGGGTSASSTLRGLSSASRYRSTNPAAMSYSYSPATHSAPPPSAATRNLMSR
jgi:hypothetical protein